MTATLAPEAVADGGGADPATATAPSGLVVVAGVVAVIVAALAGCAPTGNPTVDALIVGLGVASLTVIGSRAPWWAVTLAAGAALAIAGDIGLAVAASIGLFGAIACDRVSHLGDLARAASIGLSLNLLLRSQLQVAMGLSAAVAGAVMIVIFLAGVRQHTPVVRRVAWGGLALAAAGALIALVPLGQAVLRSRHDLRDGLRTAEEGVAALERGEFATAADLFDASAGVLDRAHDRLSSPWIGPSAVVPIAAQHRHAVLEMSASGSRGAAIVADALREIEPERLRPHAGRLDVDAITALAEPLGRVRDALADLQHATDVSSSPWLISRARQELADFDASVAEHVPSLDEALSALDLAPSLLGTDEPRTYLLAFTTPSESRGLGGFLGSYAELTIDDGALSLGRVGPVRELDEAVADAHVQLSGPEEYLAQYGRFLLEPDGRVGAAGFRNVAMTPHFPWVGEVAATMYREATGRNVDGVLALDPSALAALLRYTGPLQLTSLPQTVDEFNALPFLLHDQYVVGAADNEQRTDALAEVAALAFDSLLGGTLPDPLTLTRDLGPLVHERRIAVWSPDSDVETLLAAVDLDGAVPSPDGANGWAMTVSNAGGNKIDSYLQRRARFESTVDPGAGAAEGRLRVELTNTAPATGLPSYIIGNTVGAPPGTSRLFVSFYSPLALTAARLDGETLGVAIGEERGWNVYSAYVDIPAGETVALDLQFHGAVSRTDEIVTWTQPLATPLEPL